MTSEEILEGNKLIFEFMGDSMNNINDFSKPDDGMLCFDWCWDWLMPVIEKIESLSHPVYISSNNCIIYEHTGKDHGWNIDSYSSSKIESCWLVCVHFVEKLINNKK